jgi:condensation enzyme
MTDTSVAREQGSKRYPLSYTQEWFLSMDKGDEAGAFGRRYLLVSALRVTGTVDLAMLQGALDDVVARHELLRTIVVRDADPPYQQICPPCQVPLEVSDPPPAAGTSREMAIQELILQVQAGTISAREAPLIKALLCRFDNRDSVLFLTVHHSVCDGWSDLVILRDLGAFYAARATGTTPKLPPMRQYRDYVAWQRASATSTDDNAALKYWAGKLDGAREFLTPNDHGRPQRYSRPFSLHTYLIDPDTMAAANTLASATRGTLFMVLLSATYVLANQIGGVTDLTVNAVTSGRNQLEFHNTMGLFLNVLPFRTEIADCTTFRDIVRKTRQTVIDAMANELPAGLIEQRFPDYTKARHDPRMSQFLISQPPSPTGEMNLPIAEGTSEIEGALLDEDVSSDIPGSGTVWYLGTRPDGALTGGVHYNLDELELTTVQTWTTTLTHVLASATRNPDQNWRQL